MMKKILIIIITFIIISYNSGIHETIYQVDFIDGTSISVVGYSVITNETHYIVKSINNNSMFDIKYVKGIHPKELGVIWHPCKKK